MFNKHMNRQGRNKDTRRRGGCGREHGRGYRREGRGGGRPERAFRSPGARCGLHGREECDGHSGLGATAAEAAAEGAAVDSETCPLCRNHCPLSAPQCGNGREYALGKRIGKQGGYDADERL